VWVHRTVFVLGHLASSSCLRSIRTHRPPPHMKNQLPNRPLKAAKQYQATAEAISDRQEGKAIKRDTKRDIAQWIGADPGGNGNFGVAVPKCPSTPTRTIPLTIPLTSSPLIASLLL
jgi:hypothetical protein